MLWNDVTEYSRFNSDIQVRDIAASLDIGSVFRPPVTLEETMGAFTVGVGGECKKGHNRAHNFPEGSPYVNSMLYLPIAVRSPQGFPDLSFFMCAALLLGLLSAGRNITFPPTVHMPTT